MEVNVEVQWIAKTEKTLCKQLTTISWTSLPAYSPTTSLRGRCSAGTYFVNRALRGSVWVQVLARCRSEKERNIQKWVDMVTSTGL